MTQRSKKTNWLLISLVGILAILAVVAIIKGSSKPKGKAVTLTMAEKRTIKETVSASGKIFPETDHYLAKTGTHQNAYDMFAQGKIQELFNAFDPEVTKTAVEWANSLK